MADQLITFDQLTRWLTEKARQRDDKTCDDSQLKAVCDFVEILRLSVDRTGDPVHEAQIICASLEQLSEHAHRMSLELQGRIDPKGLRT
jgi:hypothetical protein